jgi:hypothetical protein
MDIPRRARLAASALAVLTAASLLGPSAAHSLVPDTVSPAGTVVINAGAGKVSIRAVTLTLTALDPDPGSGVTDMRFSNDGVTFSAYQPYAATAAWRISGGEGTKRVYAQFKDGAGNESEVVSDTIKLAIGPRAAFVSPPRGMTGISPLTNVTIKASERVKAATVNATTVWLVGNGTRIRSRITYNAGTRTITINPNRTLPAPLTFIVRVKGVKDLKGYRWDEDPRKAGAQSLKFFFATR